MGQKTTLDRALDILFILTESETTLTVNEISERAKIPESTIYRLLQNMEKRGIIYRQDSGEISLGMRILDMAQTLNKQIDQNLLLNAKPIMRELSEKINETSILVARNGNIGTTIHHVDGNHMIGFVVGNGRTHPLHLGASGKVILAYENQKYINRILHSLDQSSQTKLLLELEEIRKDGYSKTTGEVDPDIVGIAAPICDRSNQVIASLSIVGPKDRFDKKTTARTIKEVVYSANQITQVVSKSLGV